MKRLFRITTFTALLLYGGFVAIPLRAADDVLVEENVTYGQVGDVELKLDFARPASPDAPCPAIVYIHGGAWAGGERSAYRSSIKHAARKGYFAAAISYRLTGFDPPTKTGTTPFPAQIEDCKCAIRWVRSVAGKYAVDPDRIGVTGGSAGGHLSLLVGLVDETANLEGAGGHAEFSSRVRAVANYCGPTDLAAEYQDVKAVQPFLQALCHGTPETAADAYRQATPLCYLTKDDPPVLTMHGDQDDIVPISQARKLDEAMKAAGLSHELLVLEGQGHAIKGDRADSAFWRFFEKHLKSAPATAK